MATARNLEATYKSFNELAWAGFLLGHKSVIQKNKSGIQLYKETVNFFLERKKKVTAAASLVPPAACGVAPSNKTGSAHWCEALQ